MVGDVLPVDRGEASTASRLPALQHARPLTRGPLRADTPRVVQRERRDREVTADPPDFTTKRRRDPLISRLPGQPARPSLAPGTDHGTLRRLGRQLLELLDALLAGRRRPWPLSKRPPGRCVSSVIPALDRRSSPDRSGSRWLTRPDRRSGYHWAQPCARSPPASSNGAAPRSRARHPPTAGWRHALRPLARPPSARPRP
jgi:hypothetical protein